MILDPGSIVAGLDKKDLERLRYATRRQAGGAPLTDEQCDFIIDETIAEYGVEIVMDSLKRAVDGSLIN